MRLVPKLILRRPIDKLLRTISRTKLNPKESKQETHIPKMKQDELLRIISSTKLNSKESKQHTKIPELEQDLIMSDKIIPRTRLDPQESGFRLSRYLSNKLKSEKILRIISSTKLNPKGSRQNTQIPKSKQAFKDYLQHEAYILY